MRERFFKILLSVFISSLLLLSHGPNLAFAQTGKVGMHVLTRDEVPAAVQLLRSQSKDDQTWYYITIPFTLEDIQRKDDWQGFFNTCRDLKVIPIVRLATVPQGANWMIPNRKNVVDQLNVLANIEWPTAERRVIIFNEVNHAKEWGGKIDPEDYARIFRFGSLWAKSLQKNFIVLPAAMDLAAPNGSVTRDAFAYLDQMYAFDNQIFNYADAWNSHSYPNPAFSAPPQRQGRNSLYGYQYELGYLATRGVGNLPVYITETGWVENKATRYLLATYYKYALEKIWQPDARVVAVTPFVFQGDPGPFAAFSFLKADGKPTTHYSALEKVLGASTQ